MKEYNILHDDLLKIAAHIQHFTYSKPRSVGVTPCGRVLLNCNRDENLIGVYSRGVSRAQLVDDLRVASDELTGDRYGVAA